MFCFLFRITSFKHESGFLRRSTLMQLTDVGGHVWVYHGRVATLIRLLTALWSSPGRSYTASNSMWLVVKQTASDLREGGGGCIHSASSERQRRECQPAPSDGIAQGFGLPDFGFGCLISVCNGISVNNMSHNYAKLTKPCGVKSKQPFFFF